MEASPWIRRFAGVVRPGGEVLDVACGNGRHTRLFAQLGHPVVTVDRDVSTLELPRADPASAARVEVIEADLEAGRDWPLTGRHFACVVVTHYLHRPLLTLLVGALACEGVLLYETFAVGNERFGSPRRPEFLLEEGELLAVVSGLQILAFEQGIVQAPRPAVIQRICAVRGSGARVLPEA